MRRAAPWPAALGAAAICGAAGLISVALGPDNYWDLRFYHLYAPWAYLHDRYLTDVAPAEYQSFLNPIADFLFYAMVSSPLNAMPRTIAFVMGAVHGLNAVLVAAIAWHVLRPAERRIRIALCVVATLIGITGAGAAPLLGTTSNDLVNSIFVLAGLLGLLRAADRNDTASWRGFAWAGAAAGLGLGLKYTAGIFVPAFAVVALIVAARRRTVAGFVVFGGAAALAFLALAGHHMLTLWRDFGNPTFPMLNNIFRSPYFEPESGNADEFQARDIWQLIAYPFYWVTTRSYLVSELPLRDWRGAIAYLAIVVAVVVRLPGWLGRRSADARGGETRGLGLVIIFVVLSYVAWAQEFGNYRYAVALEMLTGVVIVGAMKWVVRAPAPRIAGALAVLVIAAATTVYPDWGRGRFGARYVEVEVPPLPPNSRVLISTGDPVAFFIPYAEPTAQYIGIDNDFLELSQDNLLVAKVRALMRATDRPTFMVSVGAFDKDKLDGLLGQFDLALAPAPCRPIRTNLENPAISICATVQRSPH